VDVVCLPKLAQDGIDKFGFALVSESSQHHLPRDKRPLKVRLGAPAGSSASSCKSLNIVSDKLMLNFIHGVVDVFNGLDDDIVRIVEFGNAGMAFEGGSGVRH
jgi:hypothetical protein